MSVNRKLIGFVLGCLLVAGPAGAFAQDNPVEQFIAEDAALGAGCNAIALVVVGLAPVAPDQAWQDDHTACVGSTVQAMAQYDDVTDETARTIVCLLLVIQGDGSFSPGCLNYQMITAVGPFGANADWSRQQVELMKEAASSRDMEAGAELFVSCADSPPIARGAIIVTVFDVDKTPGDVMFQAKVGDGVGNMAGFILPTTSS
jgi:hypothetical protein